MKTGFVPERYIVAYCHGCGSAYDTDGEGPALFRTETEAADYFADENLTTGWDFDGEKLTCDCCLATAHCAEHGHQWSGWRWSTWHRDGLPHSRRSRGCDHCGMLESEALS